MDLIFSHPSIENQFRRAMNKETELGGWLLYTWWEPKLWPSPKLSYKELAQALGLPNAASLAYVESFIIVPNHHRNPESHWSAWHYDKAKEVAEATGHAQDLRCLHFHSHPGVGASHLPSDADIAFAAANCAIPQNIAEFCIVTNHPLRLWPYKMRWGDAASPHWKSRRPRHGRFWTWRMKGLKKFR